jgi:hypothetical protein
MKITHTVANSVDRNAPKRAIQFYKSTRPQAPVRHKDSPELVGLVECSCCRGLFFKQDREVLARHRRWHEANAVDGLYYPMPCKLAVEAHEGRYMFEHTCGRCEEDLCPCPACDKQHEVECDQWLEVQDLLAGGDELAADELADEILSQR